MKHAVLITGANRGLGLEFTRQYAHEGWEVLACCRKPEQAKQLNQLTKQYNHLKVYPLDVTDGKQIQQLQTTLQDQPIDVLINNAGIAGQSGITLGNIPVDNFQRVFEVNTIAPVKITEAFLDNIARSQLKKVVVISSKMGSIKDNDSGRSYAYRSSKAALNCVMKSMSIDLKPKQITVILLHPGWVITDMGGDQALISPEQSVSDMRKVIGKISFSQSGRFYSYNGELIPW